MTTAETGAANFPNALRGTPCILEEAYRSVDATMCVCNAGFEKNDYGQCANTLKGKTMSEVFFVKALCSNRLSLHGDTCW